MILRGKAQYLIRFDDACPTANWAIWDRLEKAVTEYSVKPIVAVIPDNRDPGLKFGAACDDFWARVRAWQAKGWTIAMHGYQHVFCTASAGVIGLNQYSEFAGLSYTEQTARLSAGYRTMIANGVTPTAWIAPAHSFDDNTIRALATELGQHLLISDGLFPYPGRDVHGLMWLPQQLWRFRPMPFGVWTVCAHPSQWSSEHFDKFRKNLERYRSAITDADEVVEAYGRRRRTKSDEAFASIWRLAVRYKTGCGKRRAPALTAGALTADSE